MMGFVCFVFLHPTVGFWIFLLLGHQMKVENVPGPSPLGDMETEMDVDEDDDDDDDMEEVS